MLRFRTFKFNHVRHFFPYKPQDVFICLCQIFGRCLDSDEYMKKKFVFARKAFNKIGRSEFTIEEINIEWCPLRNSAM